MTRLVITSICTDIEECCIHEVVLFASCCSDDKREAASEAGYRLRPAWREGVRGEVGQQPAAAGGGREGSAPHWPQHCGQELQQEEHLQSTQVNQQTLTHFTLCLSSTGRSAAVPQHGDQGTSRLCLGVRISVWLCESQWKREMVKHFKLYLIISYQCDIVYYIIWACWT